MNFRQTLRKFFRDRTREIAAGRPEAILSVSLLMFIACSKVAVAAPVAGHDHEDIRRTAESHARLAYGDEDVRMDIIANELDPRVRLPRCDAPLEASVPYGKERASRMTVEVRCESSKPWKIYVPVRTAIFRQVIVAARPLARGNVLAEDDIKLAEVDTSKMVRGYIADPAHAIGQKVRRALSVNDPVTPNIIEARPTVKRGQKVTLQARKGGLTVRVPGLAKRDGFIGQVIDFENQSTKRIVQAIVRSPQAAEILLN